MARDAGLADLVGGEAGLAAAADAAAGAGHDLDEVVAGLAGLDPLDHLAGVAQAVGHGDLDASTPSRNFQSGTAPVDLERRLP